MYIIGKKRAILKRIYEVLRETPLSALREMLPDEMILEACDDAGYKFRRRRYGPVFTAFHFLLQAVQRDGSFAGTWQEHAVTVMSEMGIGDCRFNSSAMSQARSRFPKAVFESLIRIFCERAAASYPSWKGMRLLAFDTTTVSMPAEEALFEHFGRHKSRGKEVRYPIGTFCALLAVGTSLILD